MERCHVETGQGLWVVCSFTLPVAALPRCRRVAAATAHGDDKPIGVGADA
jgi:hypothetical protein